MLGDADFGVNISRGFELVIARLSSEDNPNIAKVLSIAGDTFTMEARAAEASARSDRTFSQALDEAAVAATGGSRGTAQMVAKKGAATWAKGAWDGRTWSRLHGTISHLDEPRGAKSGLIRFHP